MLRDVLQTAGHAVVEAESLEAARQALREARPAIVLTDLRLPEGDGLSVLNGRATSTRRCRSS